LAVFGIELLNLNARISIDLFLTHIFAQIQNPKFYLGFSTFFAS